MVEPWLRSTHTEIEPVRRAAIHALELTAENLHHWCRQLNDLEIHATPNGLPSVAFQLRHICGSIDRLLTYAEGRQLSDLQLEVLERESAGKESVSQLLEAFDTAIKDANSRLVTLPTDLNAIRHVGRNRLPVSLGGLIVHIADHTQRHTGQVITTVKVLLSMLGY